MRKTAAAREPADCGCVEAAIGFAIALAGLALLCLIDPRLVPTSIPGASIWAAASLVGASVGKAIGLWRLGS